MYNCLCGRKYKNTHDELGHNGYKMMTKVLPAPIVGYKNMYMLVYYKSDSNQEMADIFRFGQKS